MKLLFGRPGYVDKYLTEKKFTVSGPEVSSGSVNFSAEEKDAIIKVLSQQTHQPTLQKNIYSKIIKKLTG